MAPRPLAFVNARLVDPESGYDGPGALIAEKGKITSVSREVGYADLSPDIRRIDCNGAMLAPGLIDLRVKTGEPGAEPKETLKSAARAAAAGGVSCSHTRVLMIGLAVPVLLWAASIWTG